MSNLTPTPSLDNVPAWNEATTALGTTMNAPAQALLNRTAYLARYGALPYITGKSYALDERVMLGNGDIVQSRMANNTNDPNTNMTGWVKKGNLIEVESIAEMLAISNPQNGQLVRTQSYHEGLLKGGNTYRHESARQLENDGGSVLNGWVVQDKTSLTVWDFGYKVGDATASTQAIVKAFASTYLLKLNAETLNSHDWTQVETPINKVVVGHGMDASIIYRLKIVASGGSFIFKDFFVDNDDDSVNYGLQIENYDYAFVDGFKARNVYDAVLVWKANNEKSKAIVQNSIAVFAARIGFTADVDSKNVSFINCDTFDSHQGFHTERGVNTYYKKCRAIRCGSGAPVPWTDQPSIYAGGFRLHEYVGVTIEDCENIDKSGTNIDWLGGGGSGLIIKASKGLNFLTDDVAVGQLPPSYTFSNIEVYGSDTIIKNQGYKSIFNGYLKADGVGSIELGFNNTLSYVNVCNLIGEYFTIGTTTSEAVVIYDEIKCASRYSSQIKGFTYFVGGTTYYSWLTGDESQFPNIGFRFDAANAKEFHHLRHVVTGRGGGSQISLENINTSIFRGGSIGSVVGYPSQIDAFVGLDFSALNITWNQRLATKTQSVSTSDLSSAASSLNQKGKFLGKSVLDSSVSPKRFYRASGSGASDAWIREDDNSVVITPS